VYTFHLYDPFLFTHQRASWAGDDVKNVELPVPYPGPLRREVLNSPGLQRSYGWMWERPYGEAYLRHHLAHVFRFRDTHQVPVYCGEFGVLNLAPRDDALRYYRDVVRLLRREGIGFSNWNYKSDNFGLVTRKGRSCRTWWRRCRLRRCSAGLCASAPASSTPRPTSAR
jgi:endoglucanase